MTADDDLDDCAVTPDQARDALLHDIQVNGSRAAYEALLAVCRDPKAPAPARATAGTSLLRAGGYFAAPEERRRTKADHEMTPEELQAEITRLDRRRQRLQRKPVDAEDDGGVFG